MLKKIIALLLMLVIVCGVLAACGESRQISATRAQKIALEDMGIKAKQATVHVHPEHKDEGTYFNVYITYNGENIAYVISNTGEIVTKGESQHSH